MAGRHRQRRSRRGVALVGVLAAAGVGMAAVLALTTGEDGTAMTTGAPSTPSAVSIPSASSSPSSSPAAGPSASPSATPSASRTQAAERPPTLRLRVTGEKSWIRVVGPGDDLLLDGTLSRGAKRRFDQRRLRVTIGDASAVAVEVNGEERKRGGRRDVDTFTAKR